jgi:hypothetical protein
VINEVAGYFHDPALSLARLARGLEPAGFLVVTLYRWGNAPAIWRRLATRFKTLQATVVANTGGDKAWDIRILVPTAATAAPQA